MGTKAQESVRDVTMVSAPRPFKTQANLPNPNAPSFHVRCQVAQVVRTLFRTLDSIQISPSLDVWDMPASDRDAARVSTWRSSR